MTTSATASTSGRTPIGATVLGYPRIGRHRELKKALEAYWAGRADGAALDDAAATVRRDALATMIGAGLDSVPVNTFSWYDQMLDTMILVGAVPDRFAGIGGSHTLAGFDADRYFAMARGTEGIAPLEMTKWFDTNYHYLVPEIGPGTAFAADPAKPLAEYAEFVEYAATAQRSVDGRVVLIGPYTFLALAKAADTADGAASDHFDPLSRLDDLTRAYAKVLAALHGAGVGWVQLDEPALTRDLTPEQVAAAERCYARLTAVTDRPSVLVATYFADPVEALPALLRTRVEAVGLDLLHGPAAERIAADRELTEALRSRTLLLGAVEGHNIWRADLRATLDLVRTWQPLAGEVAVGTSCSLLHVPYDTTVETELDPRLRDVLAFADQKLAEVVTVHRALLDPAADRVDEALAASDAAVAARAAIPGVHRSDVGERLARVAEADRRRVPQASRSTAQVERLGLPQLPTTTIGSFPQTPELRRARAAYRAGRLDESGYTEQMRAEVRRVVELQERLGLDVLVHGEPERNDMVQYFAEQLDGYAATTHGWVQSYGSRCVRPPVLYGDVHRPAPMTVAWATYAQSLTDKPVKGMLTGPVTMLAWSFVRDDQPRAVTADQVALALRDEVADLEAAGIAIIQVDEPALRELLPIRHADQAAYLDWSVRAFRLATSAVRPDTQVHTHLCYSEFGEIIDAIDGLDADVTSIEAARSRMEVLADVAEHGFTGALGPGVYDIHSPRVPDAGEITELLTTALGSLPVGQLWVNPDCGLKTRRYREVEPALTAMVEAARRARGLLPAG